MGEQTKEAFEKLNRLRANIEDVGYHDTTYEVKYHDGWGNDTREKFRTIDCDDVKVDSGLVRFLDVEGRDVWTIQAERVIEYRRQ